MNKPTPHTPFLCADFMDSENIRHRSFCQVGENGKAYALADFEGHECVRIGSTISKRAEAAAFFLAVADLVDCSNRDKMAIRWEGAPDYVAAPMPRGELVITPLFALN